MEPLGSLLQQVCRQHGPEPALSYQPRYRTEVWTYDRLWQESEAVACWLSEHGVGKGDRVALWAHNSPWWVASFFGAMRLGAIVVPLDVRSSPEFVERVVTQSDPKLALLSQLTRDSWNRDTPTFLVEDFETVPEKKTGLGPIDVCPKDVAELVFTSGTTGEPKGVILTHQNITSNARGAHQVIPDLPYFRLLSILPLSHMFEQTIGLILPLLRGASIFYPPSRQSTILFRAFQQQSITTVLAVPQALQLFMDAIEREVKKQGQEERWNRLLAIAARLPLESRRFLFRNVHRRLGGEFKFFVSGGAPIDPDLVTKWGLLGIRVLQGYGATETAPVVTATGFDDHDPRTVGKAVPGVQLRIAPDGEVLVKGPNVSPGYWNNPEATAEVFQDGWYRTGDLGELNKEGYLYLRGRKKNMIVLANGQNVFPEDVELAILRTGQVTDGVVVGLPTPQGSHVHAVLLCDAATTDAEAVVRKANAELAPHQHIQGYTVWPDSDFPRTHTLKVKRQDVLQTLVELKDGRKGEATPVAAVQNAGKTPLLRLLADASNAPPGALQADATLEEDLGLDSLGRVELLAAVEAELGIYLDESRVEATTTVADLERMLEAHEAGARPTFARWPLTAPAVAARRVLQIPAFAALDLMAPADVKGAELLDGLDPPTLFVANHISHADAPAVLKAIPNRFRERVAVAAADDYFFTPRRRWWLGVGVEAVLNAFPFSRTTAIRPTLEHCAYLLDHGWSILIFPEGTRTDTGEMGRFKGGVGLLAVELEVPVVPCRIEGIDKVLPKHGYVPHRAHIKVFFGKPLSFMRGTSYDEASLAVEDAVRAL